MPQPAGMCDSAPSRWTWARIIRWTGERGEVARTNSDHGRRDLNGVQRAAAAARRWRERASYRKDKGEALRDNRFTEVDEPKRVGQRLERLDAWRSAIRARGGLPSTQKSTVAARPPALRARDRSITNERIMGATRDLLSVEFFEIGLDAARSVGRLSIEGDAQGTGFLVGCNLMMTNNHVLASPEDAQIVQLELDFEAMVFGQAKRTEVFELDPGRFFMTDPALDFALVAVKPRSRAGTALNVYGFKPLIGEQGKILVSQPVNIIQHPDGRPKEVVIRNNQLIDLFDNKADIPFCQYLADTEQGSSGSPVFNDQWEIVALHHQAIPQTNAKGELVDAAGKVIREGDDPSRVVWIANEGIRTSRLVSHIEANPPVNPAMRLVHAALLATWRENAAPAAQLAAVDDRRMQIAARNEGVPRANAGPAAGSSLEPMATSVTFSLPLRITVDLGPMSAGRGESAV
jgi:endonuclease G